MKKERRFRVIYFGNNILCPFCNQNIQNPQNISLSASESRNRSIRISLSAFSIYIMQPKKLGTIYLMAQKAFATFLQLPQMDFIDVASRSRLWLSEVRCSRRGWMNHTLIPQHFDLTLFISS
ncbi:MAG: hypothetical protein MJZ94_09195 [Bacteroidales bacterium]|nr:hypothetical protein [Bacteroidales bacterium]